MCTDRRYRPGFCTSARASSPADARRQDADCCEVSESRPTVPEDVTSVTDGEEGHAGAATVLRAVRRHAPWYVRASRTRAPAEPVRTAPAAPAAVTLRTAGGASSPAGGASSPA